MTRNESAVQPKYRAFLSYSHGDAAFVEDLHRRLESYRVPRALVGRRSKSGNVPARLSPIFRDVDELPASTDLGARLREALLDSQNLVVILSEHSARSAWVAEESRWFSTAAPGRPILYVCPPMSSLTQLHDRLEWRQRQPPNLTGEIGMAEPLVVSFAGTKEQKRKAFLQLTAGVLGISFDDLYVRDRRRRRRRIALGTAITLLSIFVIVLAGFYAMFFGMVTGGNAGMMAVNENRTLERYAKEKMSRILARAEHVLAADELPPAATVALNEIAEDAAEYIYEIQIRTESDYSTIDDIRAQHGRGLAPTGQ